MERKQSVLLPLIKIVTCMVVAFSLAALAQAQDKKVDPTGTWKWTAPGRNGAPGRTNTLTLKLEGEKLTGTVSAPGRNGETKTDIEDGSLNGNEIKFNVTREFNGNKMTAKYSGKVTDDAIKGKIETERNGKAQSRNWTATREK